MFNGLTLRDLDSMTPAREIELPRLDLALLGSAYIYDAHENTLRLFRLPSWTLFHQGPSLIGIVFRSTRKAAICHDGS
jgi:hypothetical protein